MVEIADIIAPDGIILGLRSCNSKRQVLKELAQKAGAKLGLDWAQMTAARMTHHLLRTFIRRLRIPSKR